MVFQMAMVPLKWFVSKNKVKLINFMIYNYNLIEKLPNVKNGEKTNVIDKHGEMRKQILRQTNNWIS